MSKNFGDQNKPALGEETPILQATSIWKFQMIEPRAGRSWDPSPMSSRPRSLASGSLAHSEPPAPPHTIPHSPGATRAFITFLLPSCDPCLCVPHQHHLTGLQFSSSTGNSLPVGLSDSQSFSSCGAAPLCSAAALRGSLVSESHHLASPIFHPPAQTLSSLPSQGQRPLRWGVGVAGLTLLPAHTSALQSSLPTGLLQFQAPGFSIEEFQRTLPCARWRLTAGIPALPKSSEGQERRQELSENGPWEPGRRPELIASGLIPDPMGRA